MGRVFKQNDYTDLSVWPWVIFYQDLKRRIEPKTAERFSPLCEKYKGRADGYFVCNAAKKVIVLKHEFKEKFCFSQIPVLGAGSNVSWYDAMYILWHVGRLLGCDSEINSYREVFAR
jgi:hypothetical protein